MAADMKKAFVYTAMILCISYIFAGVLILAGVLNQSTRSVISMIYMLLPLTASFILDKFVYKVNLTESWGLKFTFNRWLFLPLILIPVFVILTLIISLFFPGTSLILNHVEASKNLLTPEQFETARSQLESVPSGLYYITQILSAILAGYTINAIFAFGEEAGWRGHLLKTFEGKPFWQAWLFTGAVWGIWHAPLILLGHNYPEHPRIGVAMMTIWCILLTPMFIYVRQKAKSVYSASFLHGFLNALAGLAILLIAGGNDLTKGASGASGMIAMIIINASLYIYDVYIKKENLFLSDIKFTYSDQTANQS
jgi:membrane protease YdiL (CAAX protease family)